MTTETAPLPRNEMERLMNLSNLNIDFAKLKDSFNDLAKLAANIAGTNISQVNLIDFYTQWTVSHYGLEGDQKPREDSACQYTILSNDFFEVKDMSADARFRDKDYVVDDPAIRYYLGIPLAVGDGLNIGALCVLDRQIKVLTTQQIDLLRIVADEIVRKLQTMRTVEVLLDRVSESESAKRKVAHDIRGPLAGIIGLAQIIESQGDSNEIEEVLELVGLIQQSGNSLIELTQEILGKRENVGGNGSVFTLAELKESLRKLYEPQARQKGLVLHIESFPETEHRDVKNKRLLQIVGNLVGNALKFTPAGGSVIVKLSIELLSNNTREIEISVTDSGIGLSAEQILTITRGRVASTNGTEGEGGFGLGLGFVKNLIEADHGRLEVFSEPGYGARFTVHLPFEP